MSSCEILARMGDTEILRYLNEVEDLTAFITDMVFDEELPLESFIAIASDLPVDRVHIIYEHYGILRSILDCLLYREELSASVLELIRSLEKTERLRIASELLHRGYETEALKIADRTEFRDWRYVIANLATPTRAELTIWNYAEQMLMNMLDDGLSLDAIIAASNDEVRDLIFRRPMVLNKGGYIDEAVRLIYTDQSVSYDLETMLVDVHISLLRHLVLLSLQTCPHDSEVMAYVLPSMSPERVQIIIDAMLDHGLTYDQIAQQIYESQYDRAEDILTEANMLIIDLLKPHVRDTLAQLFADRPSLLNYLTH